MRVTMFLDAKRVKAGEGTRQFEERKRQGNVRVHDEIEKENMLLAEKLQQVLVLLLRILCSASWPSMSSPNTNQSWSPLSLTDRYQGLMSSVSLLQRTPFSLGMPD